MSKNDVDDLPPEDRNRLRKFLDAIARLIARGWVREQREHESNSTTIHGTDQTGAPARSQKQEGDIKID